MAGEKKSQERAAVLGNRNLVLKYDFPRKFRGTSDMKTTDLAQRTKVLPSKFLLSVYVRKDERTREQKNGISQFPKSLHFLGQSVRLD